MVCTNKRLLFFLFILNNQFRDYNEEEPWLISFKTQAVEMEKLSFNKKYEKQKSSFSFIFILFKE